MGPRMPGIRWWMISLIMAGAIVNHLTRSTLAGTAMAADLGSVEYRDRPAHPASLVAGA